MRSWYAGYRNWCQVRSCIFSVQLTTFNEYSYRLGPFGFLTSGELQSQGYSANHGLSDQRMALLWIQKHVKLFGGDPNNVTVMGESAGAG